MQLNQTCLIMIRMKQTNDTITKWDARSNPCLTIKWLISVLIQVDSEEERMPDEKYVEDMAKKLPQGTDKTPEVLEEALKGLPDKWVFNIAFSPQWKSKAKNNNNSYNETGFSLLQMEKLHNPRHFHAHHDTWILSNYLWRSISTHDNGNDTDTFGGIFDSTVFFIMFFFSTFRHYWCK